MQFEDIFKNRPTRAEISLSNLKHNFDVIKSYLKPEVKVMAAVKANAYGHGILEISKALQDMGCDYLAVAYIEEALYLRQSGIDAPILVMGPTNDGQIEQYLNHDIDITAASIDKLDEISDTAKNLNKTANIHLKIDTGMERIGVHSYNAKAFIDHALSLPSLNIVGLFSHLAKSEDDRQVTNDQISKFDQVVHYMDDLGKRPPLCHLANSGGVIGHPKSHYDMVRPGIALYGYFEDIQDHLKPVLTLKSKVSYFKVVPGGVGIGYGHQYITKNQTRIVTVPIGYGDGYRRDFGNKAHVYIRGQSYPVIGRVCMDQLMIDIGADGEAYSGDDVTLIGEDEFGNVIDLNKLSSDVDTIAYEILCGISLRVPRIYKKLE